MNNETIPYEKQIFVCTNDQQGVKPSCGDHKGEEIFRALRQKAKNQGIHPRIRIAQAKCLGKCSMGANIMVYPDNVWYSEASLTDVDEIVEKHFPKE